MESFGLDFEKGSILQRIAITVHEDVNLLVHVATRKSQPSDVLIRHMVYDEIVEIRQTDHLAKAALRIRVCCSRFWKSISAPVWRHQESARIDCPPQLVLSQNETSGVFVSEKAKNLVPPPAGSAGIPVKPGVHIAKILGSVAAELKSHESSNFIIVQNLRSFDECVDVGLSDANIVFVIKKEIVVIQIFGENFLVGEGKGPGILCGQAHFHPDIGSKVFRNVGQDHDINVISHAPQFAEHFFEGVVIRRSVVRDYRQDLHEILYREWMEFGQFLNYRC